MSLSAAKNYVKSLNMTLEVIHETKEIRINFKNSSEDTAYYTDNLSDAIRTAERMFDKKNGIADIIF